jgi:HK97 family phage major capsid protein
MKTLADKIKAAQEALVVLKDNLVISTEALEASPDEETLLAEVEGQTADIENKTATLNALQKAENVLKERAQPIAAPEIVKATGKDAGELWLKNAVCSFLAHTQRKSVSEVIADHYANDNALKAVQKTAVPLATTFDAGWAAELVQTDIQGFIDVLTPTSVTAALASRTALLSFGGYDSITIPRRQPRGTGNDLSGAFVGEGGAIPLGKLTLGSTTLNRYKMAVISTFSKELSERSTPQIETLIRSAILDDTSIALDTAFLGAIGAVAGIRPAGILNGITVANGDATGGLASVTADMKTMLTALTSAGLGTRPVLIINTQNALSIGLIQSALGEFVFRDEINGGRLLGVEVIRSLNVPVDTCIMVDAATLATAFDATMFDVSDVATVVEANSDGTAPTMADDGSGALGTAGQVPRNAGIPVAVDATATPAASVGYAARSLWQTYSVGVRSVTPTTWGVIQAGGVIGLKSLKW